MTKKNTRDEWIINGYIFIAKNGFSSINVKSISEEFNLKRSSFYYYFDNIQDYITEIISIFFRESVQ